MNTIDGFPLWIILLLCGGIFLSAFVDAIAGGGGIISVPSYLIAFGSRPTSYVLGTNKFSSCLGTAFSTARFIRRGYVDWSLFTPAIFLALIGSAVGAWLQHCTPDIILKYLLVAILPIVAVIVLRNRDWPDEPGDLSPGRRRAVVWLAALVIGAYDGYYGPGTGTFLMIIFIRLAKLDTRHAAGGVKVINLASNIGGLAVQMASGYVYLRVGLITAAASIVGHYLGAGMAIQNGGKLVRPTVVVVLVLLTVKVISELLFPGFWGN